MIGIKGTGIYLPETRYSNFDRMEQFGMTEDFVRDKIGFTKLARKDPEQTTLRPLPACLGRPEKVISC